MKLIILFSSILLSFSAFAQELPSGVHRLSGFDGMMAFDELQPLKSMIGPAEYVAIGEAIHTAGSYADGRFRITRFLIEDMGFRSVGIEAPWSEVGKINEYIQTCKGSITEAGAGIYRPWKDQAFVDFAHWACQYNQKHLKDPIYFYGFDTQYQIGYAAKSLTNYLQKTAPQDTKSLSQELKTCFGVEYITVKSFRDYARELAISGKLHIPKENHEACIAGTKVISKYLDKNKNKLVKNSSKKDFLWALVSLTTLQYDQGHFYYMSAGKTRNNVIPQGYDSRDLGMSDMTTRIKNIERPNTRTVLWAHNAHLAKNSDNISLPDYREYRMGVFLAQQLGKNYFPIAQIGYSVAVDDNDFYGTPSKITEQPKSTDPRSIEFIMHNFGSAGILADSSGDLFLPGSYKSQWMTDALEFVPAEQFNAYIFHEVSRMFIPWKDPK